VPVSQPGGWCPPSCAVQLIPSAVSCTVTYVELRDLQFRMFIEQPLGCTIVIVQSTRQMDSSRRKGVSSVFTFCTLAGDMSKLLTGCHGCGDTFAVFRKQLHSSPKCNGQLTGLLSGWLPFRCKRDSQILAGMIFLQARLPAAVAAYVNQQCRPLSRNYMYPNCHVTVSGVARCVTTSRTDTLSASAVPWLT
jgi:hypothetical protein